MSGFLLDTNIPSELVRTLPEPRVKDWIAAQTIDTLYLSVVSIGELHKGFTIMPESRRRAQLKDWLENCPTAIVCWPDTASNPSNRRTVG